MIPLRRKIILELAHADDQPWTSAQDGSGWTDHMGEMMYGKLADAVEGLMAEAWDEGVDKGQQYRSDLDLSPLNPYRTEE